MADVAAVLRDDRSTRADDRGQLFLIGALSLAVVFLTVALLLNTAIYTENLATRSSGTGSAEVIEYQTAAQEHTTTQLTHVNREHNTTEGDLQSNYTESVESWDQLTARHRATEGHVSSVTLTGTTNGTRIVQDETRNFTDGNTSASWTLVEGANARNYTMTVRRDSLTETDLADLLSDEPFHVNFTANGDVRTVYIYEEAGTSTVNVTVRDGGGSTIGSCQVSQSEAEIDITGATLNGDDCAPLSFFGTFDSGYDVSYQNATEAEGTYSVTVDKQTISADGEYNDDDSGDSPYLTPALYDATFDLVYETPKTYYESGYRIAPGEPDA